MMTGIVMTGMRIERSSAIPQAPAGVGPETGGILDR